MNNPEELSISELRRRRQQGVGPDAAPAGRPQATTPRVIDVGTPEPAPMSRPALKGNAAGRYLRALRRNWIWLAVAAIFCGVAGLLTGYAMSRYTASLTLVQRDTAGTVGGGSGDESFKPRQFSPATMVQLMVAPELMRRVAALAMPEVTEAELRESVRVRAAADRELVTVTLAGSIPQELVNLLNLYARQAVSLTREIQIEDCVRLHAFLTGKLADTDDELEKVRASLEAFQTSERTADPEAQTKALLNQLGEVMTRLESARMEAELLELQSADAQRGDLARQSMLLERLKQAREKLSEKLARMTEAHPEVVSLQAEIAELERQLSTGGTNASPGGVNTLANVQLIELKARKSTVAEELRKQEELRESLQKRLASLSQKGLQYQLIKARQESLFRNRQLLADRQRAAQLYQENASGYYRVLAEATLADVSQRGRYVGAGLGLGGGLLLGLLVAIVSASLVEARDDRIRTVEDVEEATGLPVLAALGDLSQMTDEQKDRWAFRTWTTINGKLDRAPDRGLVCGLISARDGEGKSTWIDLLVSAARKRGLRVLKVTARAESARSTPPSGQSSSPSKAGSSPPSNLSSPSGTAEHREPADTKTSNALLRPAEVALQLADSSAGAVDVCLPDWVWNLEHRRQWQAALERWKGVENVVILVELPAAGLPESMLLAENVPQLIWLTASGMARARETRIHLDTLKHARCQIVGVVLNKNPGSLLYL